MRGVKHAGPATLERLADLLDELRSISGLVEPRPGVFHRKGRAFLHFHEDPTGAYADVRLREEFERHRVETADERQAFVSLIRTG